MSYTPITESLIGQVIEYAGTTAPPGHLLCYGQEISRSTYSALYAIIGDTYGAGDGLNTFNLPDRRGRAGVGKDDMGGVAANRITSAGSGIDGTTLGATGGSQTHTLTVAQMPSHTHIQNSHVHSGGYNASTLQGGPVNMASGAQEYAPVNTGSATATNQNTGGGTEHNNTQPSIVFNYIIKY